MRMRVLAMLCLMFFSFDLQASFLYECRESLKSESAESTEIILEALGYEDCKALDAEKDSIEQIWINSEQFNDGRLLRYFLNLRSISIVLSSMSDVSWLASLKKVEYLRLFGNPIQDITSLENLSNLRFLSLGNTKVASIEPILGLKKLEELFIYHCHNIKSVRGISRLKSLTMLDLLSNKLKDLSEISYMPNLKHLDVSYSKSLKKPPFTSIATNESLEILVIANTDLRNTKHLSRLRNLRFLDIAGTGLNDISEFSGLSRLETLNASLNSIVDISPIADLQYLRKVKLSSNMIEDVSVLKNHPSLETVNFTSNPIFNPDAKNEESCPLNGSNMAIYRFCNGEAK